MTTNARPPLPAKMRHGSPLDVDSHDKLALVPQGVFNASGREGSPPGTPLCQRSCRLNRIGTFGGADSRKWLDTDKRTKIG